MFTLKRLSREGIPGALAKAERYRLLHEAWQAESICRDILEVEPANQAAAVMLVLALTDQFDRGITMRSATEALARLSGAYEQVYYRGIISERRAKALLDQDDLRSGPAAYDLIREAMSYYERAEAVRPAGNDDALLRWNTCARLLMRNRHLQPAEEPLAEPVMSD